MERNIAYIALFAALITVLGLVPRIELAAGVPITAQSLGIMLCGTVLGARRGALAVLLFLALLAVGLPLLSGGRTFGRSGARRASALSSAFPSPPLSPVG